LKELEDCFQRMMDMAEEELWVNVEFIHGFNSFWMSTPLDELEEDELQPFGIIEIGDDQDLINKIIALAHEVGHCLHKKSPTFKDVSDTMFSESVAWFLGYNWFFDRNIVINMGEYQKYMVVALEMYRKELE
tara:strand:+ start:1317 stop:1712 length:396 start_codon:yes stop_codon:yes gene_type:complete